MRLKSHVKYWGRNAFVWTGISLACVLGFWIMNQLSSAKYVQGIGLAATFLVYLAVVGAFVSMIAVDLYIPDRNSPAGVYECYPKGSSMGAGGRSRGNCASAYTFRHPDMVYLWYRGSRNSGFYCIFDNKRDAGLWRLWYAAWSSSPSLGQNWNDYHGSCNYGDDDWYYNFYSVAGRKFPSGIQHGNKDGS